MRSLTAVASEQEALGFFRIFATPPGGYQREITLFRDAPVIIGTVTTQDPFTEQTAQLTLPADHRLRLPRPRRPGLAGAEHRHRHHLAEHRWLRLRVELGGLHRLLQLQPVWSDSSFTIDLKGALYGLDDYLAIPTYPKRPIPYEILIAQAFDQDNHPAHLGGFRILFPARLGRPGPALVPEFDDPNYLVALKPWGVAPVNRGLGSPHASPGPGSRC